LCHNKLGNPPGDFPFPVMISGMMLFSFLVLLVLYATRTTKSRGRSSALVSLGRLLPWPPFGLSETRNEATLAFSVHGGQKRVVFCPRSQQTACVEENGGTSMCRGKHRLNQRFSKSDRLRDIAIGSGGQQNHVRSPIM